VRSDGNKKDKPRQGKKRNDYSKLLRWRITMLKKILVVEDEPDARQILVIWLRHMNHNVIEAVHGYEAINKAVSENPELIIIDLDLPRLDGIQATRRLKQNPQTAHIPVVALTAWPEEDYKDQALRAGIAKYLIKPAPPKVLKEVIEQFLNSTAVMPN
jgi:two-component system, cell cycle response regulator DivK